MGKDVLSLEGMIPFLSDKKTAEKIQIHACLESTNKTAKELAAAGAPHGTVIMADHQTAGKGRLGRSFFSPPMHGIYMSFIARPTEPMPLLTPYAAVAVCEAIESATEKKPQIKWVNDIFLNGKKICGILTEAAYMQWAVVGIGINFDVAEADFPEHLRDIAGSVFFDGEPTTTRNRLAAEIINKMAGIENRFGKEETLGEYKKRLIMLGKKVTVADPFETYEALAMDIDEIGRLIVKKKDGKILSLSSGEIKIYL